MKKSTQTSHDSQVGQDVQVPNLGSGITPSSKSLSSAIRTGRHCVFKLHVHLVFVTKYRRKVFTDEILKDIEIIFRDICQDFESELVEMNGESEYIHLLLNYPPKFSISKLVNSLKGVSSRLIRKQHPELVKHYWKGSLWSPSYFAGSCGGDSLSTVNQYIESEGC